MDSQSWRVAALFAIVLGVDAPLSAQASPLPVSASANAPTASTELPAWRLAENVVLRIPGSSRFAGDIRGADSVRAHLAALGALSSEARAPVELYSTAEGRLLVLTRTTIQAGDSRRSGQRAVQVIAIPTFDERGDVQALDLFIDDLPAFDRRAPRDDGIRVASLAMQRNLEQVRARYGRRVDGGRAARVIAGNAHQVVVLFDGAGDGQGSHPAVMRYRFDAAGRVQQVEQFAPGCLVAMGLWTTGR